jgi:hypothetical protein
VASWRLDRGGRLAGASTARGSEAGQGIAFPGPGAGHRAAGRETGGGAGEARGSAGGRAGGGTGGFSGRREWLKKQRKTNICGPHVKMSFYCLFLHDLICA